MTSRSKDSFSLLEKNFQTQSTFKRNSRYYDAQRITNMENMHSVKRRKPFQIDSPRGMLSSNFTNSSILLTEKVSKEIEKYRDRVSPSPQHDDNQSASSRETSPVSPKVKSFSIGKMISRSQINKKGKKPEIDERLFNNFKIEKHDLSKTCNFGKLKGREMDLTMKHINDLYHQDHQKIYQECFYKKSSMHCKFNYKLQNKARQRYFFNKRRPQNDPSTILNPEKVDSGLKIASNFKGSNLRRDGFDPFYRISGRNLPSNFDNRFMNELTNHYKGENGKIEKQKLDYTLSKLKQDLDTDRKEKFKQSKRPTFARNQICDQRYFKMNIE